MPRITYIVSDVDKALAFEWIAQSLSQKCDLAFILIGPEQSALADFLATKNIRTLIIDDSKYPGWFSKFKAVLRGLRTPKPDVVHTHLWRANIIGLTTAWLLRVEKRIYTRHHALVHHHEYKKGLWLDKWCNFIATDIVAISKNIVHILNQMEGVPQSKIRLVHHGFDLSYFKEVHEETVERVRQRWGIAKDKKPVVGVVARYEGWKGIQYIIPAFKKIRANYPKAHLILANATGNYAGKIKELLHELPNESYSELPFEGESAALFRLFDVYVHVPSDSRSEAFGQTYVEAMASGVPSVFTLSGVAPEFIQHNYNAVVVPFESETAIFEAVMEILNNSNLRTDLIANGKESVKVFELKNMIKKLETVYGC